MSSPSAEKLSTRVITALVITPPSIFLIYYDGVPFLIFLALCFCLAQVEWFSMTRDNAITKYYLLGIIYLTLCFYCFMQVGSDKSIDAVLLLILVASSDIGAYFVGRGVGGPKMAKKISPNKTWSGLVGAVLTPAIVLILAEIIFLDYMQKGAFQYVLFFVFGCLIGLFSQIGDILVSLMKRQAGVKDTGTILPGHGGILDRVDSLLLAAPVFMILEYIIGHV